MKLKIISTTLYGLLIIFSSCISKTNDGQNFTRQNKVNDDLTKIQYQAKIKNDSLETSENKNSKIEQSKTAQNKCEIYWKKLDSLNKIKQDLFNKYILTPTLYVNKTSKGNQEFLKALDEFLKQDRNTKYSKYAFDQIIAPVFTLGKNQTGIIGNLKYDFEVQNQFVEINLDGNLLDKAKHAGENGVDNMDKLVLYKATFDSIFLNKKDSIFLYTDKSKIKSKMINFGYYQGPCLEYYNYLVDTTLVQKDEKLLLASKFDLDLWPIQKPKIDSLIKSSYAKGCYDCSFKFEPEKTFAILKGVPNLYFTYTDTFPINNQFDYPERALVMVLDNKKIDLWTEDIDLFGCSCL